MIASDFLKTIYLGDRACKSITIDGYGKRIAIQIDEISRIRSVSGKWDYYNDENITDGLLVFADVKSIVFDPIGLIPNDYINDIGVEPINEGYDRFTLSVSSVNEDATSTEVKVIIDAKQVYLEDPAKPGERIEN